MAKETYKAVSQIVSSGTQAFGNASQRRTRADAVINTAMRARAEISCCGYARCGHGITSLFSPLYSTISQS